MGHHGTRTCYGVLAYLERRYKHGIASDKSILANFSRVLQLAIVVTGYRTSANVDIAANPSVADVREMPHLDAFIQGGIFDFAKVAHVHAVFEYRVGT